VFSLPQFRRLPWTIVVVAALLVVAGLAGISRCEEFPGGGGRFLRQQLVWAALAAVLMLATTLPSYRLLCRWSYAIYAVAIGLLIAVYWFPALNDAHRWIRRSLLGVQVGVQPSELAKVAYVLALARYLMYRENYRRLLGLVMPLALTVVPVLLILKEPDLGTASVFLPVLFIVLFAAGARRVDLAKLTLMGLALMPVLWGQMSRDQRSRVTALFQQAGPGEKANDQTFQLRQGKQILALGGVWGSLVTSPTASDPAVYFLPEARSDFIFCVLGEQFGLWGLGLLLTLYSVLLWRGLAIAAQSREPFGRLVAAGLTGLLAVQVIVNTGMNVGLLPVTGVSLPLVSYGGSGLVAQAIALGLLMNVALRPGYELGKEPFRFAEGKDAPVAGG